MPQSSKKTRKQTRPGTAGTLFSWTLGPRTANQNLGHFVQHKTPKKLSFRQIKGLLEAGCGRVNGELERFASRKLKANDRVQFLWPLNVVTKRQTQAFTEANILFQDEHCLIIDKPSGLSVTLDKNSHSLPKAFENLAKSQGLERLFPAHRLDRETSGALILGKNAAAQRKFFALFKQRAIHKAYEALVNGQVERKKGQFYSRMAKISEKGGGGQWGSVKNGGREALTHYSLIQDRLGLSHLRLFPKTGRTHQIRVHLSEAGHPILGDRLYGRHAQWNQSIPLPQRLMLHARGLIFRHPITQQPLAIEAPLPEDFLAILRSSAKPAKIRLDRNSLGGLEVEGD